MRSRSGLLSLVVVLFIGLAAGGFLADAGPAVRADGEVTCVAGDINGDGAADVSDAVYLLTYLFQGGPGPAACAKGPVSTAVIVRHADRDANARDCPESCPTACINEAGRERAARLADMLADVEVDLLVASALCRTRETLEPAAQRLGGLPIEEIADPEEVAARLLDLPQGSTSVVAHHSFTLHRILEGLGLADVRDIPVAGDNYDNFLIVQLPPCGDPRLVRLHY